jgi:dienelactone hydrolase
MPYLHISPRDSLVDEPLEIRIMGARPGSIVTLEACLPHRDMSSQAVFKTARDGFIDLSQQAPASGSYDWVDPMGLIWTMASSDTQPGTSSSNQDLRPFEIAFSLLQDSKVIETQTITRRWLVAGARRKVLHEGELRGVCFFPPGKGPFPAVLIVSGSGGGINEQRAALFVNHGYVSLTLGYFAYQDRPRYLTEIPLEYFEQAARWLQKQPAVDKEKLVITGASRGGELSLLLGATFPFFKTVVANVPSSQVWSGFGGEDGFSKPAWTHHGEPVLFHAADNEGEMEFELSQAAQEPIPLTPMFLKSLEDEEFIRTSTIPVENIQGAILLISGDDDQMWPSTLFCERVTERLKKTGFTYPYKHCRYAGAGHMIVGGYMPLMPNHGLHPVDGMDYAFGGNPRGQAFANADSWKQQLQFLEENLRT